MPSQILRIATRKSPLALWQAEHIALCLSQIYPDLEIEFVKLTTSGDRFLQDKLLAVGGKGLFVKELEDALLNNRADLAVHSMKDMPSVCPDGLMIAAISSRENPYDAFVSEKYSAFHTLPKGARIGTSSLRRQTQLLYLRNDLNMVTLRGNIHTRLQKMQQENFDAIILAAAGLRRMNMSHHIREIFPKDQMLPACGQGALGLECRVDDALVKHLIAPLNDPKTSTCVLAERKLNALLGGNCHAPIAIFASFLNQNDLLLEARVASVDGQILLQSEQQGSAEDIFALAHACAEELFAKGAYKLLRQNTI